MSSRQLRKLQQQRELEAQAKLAEKEDEESDEEPVIQTKPKASLFAGLADLEDEEDDSDDNVEPESTPADPEIEEKHLNDPAPTSTARKPKKSKKKKKGKNKAKAKVEAEKESGDEVDIALKELALKPTSGNASTSQIPTLDPEYERVCQLLGVQTQHLKVANEMRNLFGREVLENHDDAGGRMRGNRRQRGARQNVDLETALKGHHGPGKGLSEITIRRNIFIQGKDDWPKGTTGGLTMEIVDSGATDGTVEFRYVHDKTYQDLQKTFRGYVEIGDPQNLIGLLTRNPYHISLLIQVSKIAKDQSDHALATELLERALFSFGRASISIFNSKLAQGKARLDFSRPENRELFLAGYHYIKALVMKGTYRTAFEWAKLLLSLEPEGDPYCMRLMIHHLALRAHEFNWILNLGESTFSKIWSPDGLDQSNAASHTTPSLAFAALKLREPVETRKLLTDSMTNLPWVFGRLFKELSLDAPPSIWGIQPRTDAETLFTEIYVLQTKDLWNTPEATSLLMEIAHTIKTIDVDAIPKLDNKEMTLDVVRFVYLENTPALMAMVPSSLLHRENNSDSDPLPPVKNTFSYEAQRAAISIRERGIPGAPGIGGDFLDPLAAIGRLIPNFRAMLANNDVGETEESLRRGLEDIIQNEGHESDDPGSPHNSLAERLLAMMGLGGDYTHDGLEEEEEDSWEDEDEFVDAEEEMESDDEEETDDNMPGLVAL